MSLIVPGDIIQYRSAFGSHVWAEVAEECTDSDTGISVYPIEKQGNKYHFNLDTVQILRTQIVQHISDDNYLRAWKRAGFKVFDDTTLVSINNETDLGEYDSYSSDDDEDEGGEMDDFIVSDDEPIETIEFSDRIMLSKHLKEY